MISNEKEKEMMKTLGREGSYCQPSGRGRGCNAVGALQQLLQENLKRRVVAEEFEKVSNKKERKNIKKQTKIKIPREVYAQH